VAAASGRLDGLAAVAGIFGGSFLFGEVFPLVRGFYESTPLGPLTITDLIGAPRWVIAAAITGIAIAGFVFAARIERRPTPTTGSAQLADHR
jgi:hypothetical protein